MRTIDVTEEPLCHINLGNQPDLEPLLDLTVRQRMEAINSAKRHRTFLVEDELMILGAISLMKSGMSCEVPEHVVELLTWVALEWGWLQRATDGE